MKFSANLYLTILCFLFTSSPAICQFDCFGPGYNEDSLFDFNLTNVSYAKRDTVIYQVKYNCYSKCDSNNVEIYGNLNEKNEKHGHWIIFVGGNSVFAMGNFKNGKKEGWWYREMQLPVLFKNDKKVRWRIKKSMHSISDPPKYDLNSFIPICEYGRRPPPFVQDYNLEGMSFVRKEFLIGSVKYNCSFSCDSAGVVIYGNLDKDNKKQGNWIIFLFNNKNSFVTGRYTNNKKTGWWRASDWSKGGFRYRKGKVIEVLRTFHDCDDDYVWH